MSAPKKLQMPNFTEPEISALVDDYEEYKIAIEAKGDGPHGSQAKRRAWERITATVFAVSGIRREVAEVKKGGPAIRVPTKSAVRSISTLLTYVSIHVV
uniref:Regulatory protein zeste n=1 Tax=Ixodes ricinus TaxID=34613 RepID=A0A147BBE2_IXORI